MNYDFPQKNHWRGRIWNELAERVTVHPRDAVVLYLAAESDMDRPTARRKGFHEHNLIAVDLDPAAVAGIRKGGGLAVCGDLFDVLTCWPSHTPIHAVIADFTGGLTKERITRIGQAMTYRATADAVFVANLLRGRDADPNLLREALIASRTTKVAEKHRGVMLCLSAIWEPASCMVSADETDKRAFVGEMITWFHALTEKARTVYGSYKSTSGQYFDWAIWGTSFVQDATHWLPHPVDPRLAPLERSIAAVLAHRTRRIAHAA